MKIELTKIATDFKGEYCFTHARGVITPSGFGVLTTQPLRLSGSDIFYGMYLAKTFDGGKTWSPLVASKTLLRREDGEGRELAMCDATPMYHKKTGKILLLGHYASYVNDEAAPYPHPRHTAYSVYNEETGDFDPFELIDMPKDENETYYSCGNGSGQSLELPNGELLIPIYQNDKKAASDPWHSCSSSSVMRCSFDGEKILLQETGNALTVSVPRGIGEPSVVYHKGRYFLALRNDVSGYVSRGDDGLHYEEPRELVFDNGENVGNYCTQQHWITGGGKLWMVYTRRGANNDHIFRHRAPLFIAEFDPDRMCLIRATETVAVPERGARLGNFGCQSLDDGHAIVFASEWMQTTAPDYHNWRRCMEYGSDNTIFVSHICF